MKSVNDLTALQRRQLIKDWLDYCEDFRESGKPDSEHMTNSEYSQYWIRKHFGDSHDQAL
jgi:hypothetical protein